MTLQHLVCHDCNEFESVEELSDEAARELVDEHEETTGHNADHLDIDSESKRALTDGGRTEQPRLVFADHTTFQQLIIDILAEGPKYGLAIKRNLEAIYGTEVNHGRLYPNLDDLVEAGFVTKGELDKRTNEYELTDEGRQAALDHLEWRAGQHGVETDLEEKVAAPDGGEKMYEFDLTVRKIATRNIQTDEEGVAWNVESEHLERPCRADTPADALRVLADSLELDDSERASLSVEQLAGETERDAE